MSTPTPSVDVLSKVIAFYDEWHPIGGYKLPIRIHVENIARLMDAHVDGMTCFNEVPSIWLNIEATSRNHQVGPLEVMLQTKHRDDKESDLFFTLISFPLARIEGLRHRKAIMRNKEAKAMIKRSWLPLTCKSFVLELLKIGGNRVKVVGRVFGGGAVTWTLAYDEVLVMIQFNEAYIERHLSMK